MVNDLGYESIALPVSKKDYKKILNNKKNICINAFCHGNGLNYLIHISKQKLKDYMDLVLINIENKSHYFYIKDIEKIG